MEKILIIFTGGTIGSAKNESGERDVVEGTGNLLIDGYYEKFGKDIEFDEISPYNILSENCNPSHWQKLCSTLGKVDFSRYKGIVLTHGSDTLPYTSALMGLLFGAAGLPIVIIASNHPLGYPQSNGYDNFFSAVNFIKYSGENGVFVVYRNEFNQSMVYLSTRVEEQLRYGDTLYSFGGKDYGVINDKTFVRMCPTPKPLPFDRQLVNNVSFDNRVIAIKSYPGLDYSCFNLHSKVKAILCILYHSSTWCNRADLASEDKYYLMNFFERCKAANVDMYLCSFKDGAELYKSCGQLIGAGAVPLKNISFEAAYMKLNIAYNQSLYPPLEYIKKNVFAEYLT